MDKLNAVLKAVLKGGCCYRNRKVEDVQIKNGLLSYFIWPMYFSFLSTDCPKRTYNLHETYGSQKKNGVLFDIYL